MPADIYHPSVELGAFIQTISDPVFPSADGQFDIFSFNFNGNNGQFILDTARIPSQRTNKPVLLNYSDLKINYNPGDGSDFLITTNDGTQYFFGGVSARESSRTSSSGTNCGGDFAGAVNVAFYLNKVIHPNSDTVTLSYTPINYNYKNSRSESIFAYDRASSLNPAPPGMTVPNSTNCVTTIYTSGVLLQKMQSNLGTKVEFSYINRNDINDKLLSSIKIYPSLTGAAMKTFNLAYVYSQPTSTDSLRTRPFLKSVTELSSDNISIKRHVFSYNDIAAVPSRLSVAQDYFGYYNGKSNSTLIPVPTSDVFRNKFPQASANRNIDPAYLTKGLLSSITYPTGGKDSIVYESNQIYASVVDPPTYSTLSVSGTNNSSGSTNFSSASWSCPITQQIVLNASCTQNSQQQDPTFKFITIKLVNLTSGAIVVQNTIQNNATWQTTVDLNSGTNYQLQMAVWGTSTGNANFTYRANAGGMHNAAINSGGARVAKVITQDNISGISSIKKISYNIFGTDQSSGHAMYGMRYEKMLKRFYQDNSSGFTNCAPTEVDYLSMYSSSIDNIYVYGASSTTYANVEEIFGEEGDNGKISHVYTVQSDILPDIYWGQDMMGVPHTSYSYKNGKETYTETSKKNGPGYTPIKKVFIHFKEDSRVDHTFYSYLGSKNYNNSGNAPATCQNSENIYLQFSYGEYDLSAYRTFQKWVYVDTVKTWNYDAAGQNYTEEKTITEYGNPLHALATKVTLFTSDGSTKTIANSYPADLSLTGDAEIGRQALVSRSISPLLKQSVAKNTNTLYTVSTNYSVFSNGLVLPKNKNVQVGSNPVETRVVFNSYDTKGNITDESISSGPSNSYTWAYNKQYPIAQATNAQSNDIYYDSFEEVTGNSTLNDSKTGHYSHTGAYSKSLTGLDAGSYTLSYWQKSGTVWSQVNTTVVVPATTYTISLNAQVDDIRFYPVTALMTTFTYDPLVGVTSTTDPKGEVNYYEYDTFQRLVNIKDKDGKIIKHTDYHYQGQ
ncbi:MAG: hypothetical protein V4456_16385 [Bacteroidota bacterium]